MMPEVFIPSMGGRLEAKFHHSNQKGPITVLLHAHPLFGGCMNNPIMYQLYWAAANLDHTVVRFNFRGVGLSEGVFSGGDGEYSDANAVVDWITETFPSYTYMTIVGFSFGAWVGAQLMARRPEISKFVAIAPPSKYYDFNFMAEFCPAESLFVCGDNDLVAPRSAVEDMLFAVRTQNELGKFHLENIEGANHFFEDRLTELVSVVSKFIDREERE